LPQPIHGYRCAQPILQFPGDIERGIMGAVQGSPPNYIVTCHVQFESIDTFLAAWLGMATRSAVTCPTTPTCNP